MNEHEALSAAILALNTIQEPDATTNEDWNYLDAHAEEVKTVLIGMPPAR